MSPVAMERHVTMPLAEWTSLPKNEDEYQLKNALKQARYVREIADLYMNRNLFKSCVLSVGEHQSRSVVYPVYRLVLPDIGWVQFRGNGYNWIISCNLSVPIPNRFDNLFNPNKAVLDVLAEGFKYSDVFESFAANRQRFTVEVQGGAFHHVYVFMFILRATLRELGFTFPI